MQCGDVFRKRQKNKKRKKAQTETNQKIKKLQTKNIENKKYKQNIAKIANAVPVTLYSRVTVNVEIVVLNCQKCNQCLKGQRSRTFL